MKPVLEVERLYMAFGKGRQRKAVLGGLTLEVAEGEFVSLIGPSGSGKSTLFQLIGGLALPDAGEIRMEGHDITGTRGHIAYMPQQASLLPWLTVADNVQLALEVTGVGRREAEQQAEQWLSRVGLADYAGQYPGVLSGGMQQRVSFVRALLTPRKLMCLDEPFGALDALTRLQMQQWLLKLWEANRRSVLLVTHSIEEALLLSDRVVVISASPAVVLEQFEVPFARPRGEQLWTDPQFNYMKQQIYSLLRQEGVHA